MNRNAPGVPGRRHRGRARTYSLVAAFFALGAAFAVALGAAFVVVAAFFGAALALLALAALALAVLALAVLALAVLALAGFAAGASGALARFGGGLGRGGLGSGGLAQRGAGLAGGRLGALGLAGLAGRDAGLGRLRGGSLAGRLDDAATGLHLFATERGIDLAGQARLAARGGVRVDRAGLRGAIERAERLGEGGLGVDRRCGRIGGRAQCLRDIRLRGTASGLEDLAAALGLTDPLES